MERKMKKISIDCQIHYNRNTRKTARQLLFLGKGCQGKVVPETDGTPSCDYDVCAYKCFDPTVEESHLPIDYSSTVGRSEEHTSELQSQFHLVCRLLLEKKN